MPTSPNDVTIENHLGTAVWRPHVIKVEQGKNTTFLFAEQLEFGDENFSYRSGTAPRNLFIFCQRLVLTGKTIFDLVTRTREDPDGGNLIISANAIEVRRGAVCTMHLRGWIGRDGERPPRNPAPPPGTFKPKNDGLPGGNGGWVVIICPNFASEAATDEPLRSADPPIELVFPAPKDSLFEGHAKFVSGSGAFVANNSGGYGGEITDPSVPFMQAFAANGQDGRHLWLENWDEGARWLPDWILGLQNIVRLEAMLHNMNEAVRKEDARQLLQEFLRYKALQILPVPQSLSTRLDTTIQSIEHIKRERLKPVWSDTITVQTIAGAKILQRFVERGTLSKIALLLPTC